MPNNAPSSAPLPPLLEDWYQMRAVDLSRPVDPMQVAGMVRSGDQLASQVRRTEAALRELLAQAVCWCDTEADELGNEPPNGQWGDRCVYCRARDVLSLPSGPENR